MSIAERLSREFQEKEKSPWGVANDEKRYRGYFCDGQEVDQDMLKYPDIRESFGY